MKVDSRAAAAAGTVSVLVLRAIDAALAARSVLPGTLCIDLGLPPALLRDGEARVPAKLVLRAFSRAVELTGNDAFGLDAASSVPVGAMELLDFSMRSSSTLGDALDRLCRYYPLIDDASCLTVERHGELARFCVASVPARPPSAATEMLFALLLDRGRALTGLAWSLREVRFRAQSPRSTAAHHGAFGAPVRFGCPRSELLFDAAWLERRCVDEDVLLARYVDRQAAALLEKLAPATVSFKHEVLLAITHALRSEGPRIEVIARRLGTSERSLQRRLHDERSSFAELVLEARRDVALRLLEESWRSIGEVAYLLGFSEPSTFHRAFKRWTGRTPAEQRRLARCA